MLLFKTVKTNSLGRRTEQTNNVSNLIEFLSSFQLGQSLQAFAFLFTQDVPHTHLGKEKCDDVDDDIQEDDANDNDNREDIS